MTMCSLSTGTCNIALGPRVNKMARTTLTQGKLLYKVVYICEVL